MKRLFGMLAVLLALTGCVGDSILDFFESGFSDNDEDNDDSDNDNDDELTEADLAGDWDVLPETSTTVLIGTWTVSGTVAASFLANVGLDDPATTDRLEITETELTFRNAAEATLGTFDFEIITANQMRLISVTPTRTITTALSSNGTRLTLTDTDGTSTAVFDIDDQGPSIITEYNLRIITNQWTSTITRNDGNDETTETVTETAEITSDSTIELTEGSNPSITVRVTLSDSNSTLKLVFPSDDRHHRGTAVFDK